MQIRLRSFWMLWSWTLVVNCGMRDRKCSGGRWKHHIAIATRDQFVNACGVDLVVFYRSYISTCTVPAVVDYRQHVVMWLDRRVDTASSVDYFFQTAQDLHPCRE
jgi:hypothetical protein